MDLRWVKCLPRTRFVADGFYPSSALTGFASNEALLAYIDSIDPELYARSRNALDGAVTRLSAQISHGLTTVPFVLHRLSQQHALTYDSKIVFEFAWREFFQHVWSHLGDGIFDDQRDQVWLGDYADHLPTDIIQANTGVPAIDQAVRELYEQGYLHNHARMWLASYIVHLRKVHWSVGADWMYGHLLDGDLASNHLSWQWVAGTFSNKPYVFNAENVAKYAPANGYQAWMSKNTVIDTDYASLEAMAREEGDCGPEPVHRRRDQQSRLALELTELVPEPDLRFIRDLAAQTLEPAFVERFTDLASEKGGLTYLVQPWDLGLLAMAPERATTVLGVIHLPFHAQFPWSRRRWAWVLGHMARVCDQVVVGDLSLLLKPSSTGQMRVCLGTMNAGYREVLPNLARLVQPERQFSNPSVLCPSFTRFYQRVQKDQRRLKLAA